MRLSNKEQLKAELQNLYNQFSAAKKQHEKKVSRLGVRLDLERIEYYSKFSNVKGFKSRFVRNSKTIKAIQKEIDSFSSYSSIVLGEIKILKDKIKQERKPRKIEKGNIYDGDLFGFIRGGRNSDVLAIIKRKAANRLFYSIITIEDTDLKGFTTKEYLQNMTFIIDECYKLGSDVFFGATCLAQYEMSDTHFYLAIAIQLDQIIEGEIID